MVVFPESIVHEEMLDAVKEMWVGAKNRWELPHRHAECVGAGFIFAGKCFGASESVGVKSRMGVDTELFTAGGERFIGVSDVKA